MFNNLANYLLGIPRQEEITEPLGTEDVLVGGIVEDDDWVLVDRDSEGDTDINSSLDSIPDILDYEPSHNIYKPVSLLTRTSSTSSLPCTSIEDSWFLTPPPCFTSTGPVHMETSPLENLLIEHPSMSVYQHSNQPAITVAVAVTARRHSSAPGLTPTATPPHQTADETASSVRIERPHTTHVMYVQPRPSATDTLKLQERQCIKIKNAQKLQIHKTCQSLKRGYFERNNKAREVNCRNHRQRRGEKSQGSARSNANNNRKC